MKRLLVTLICYGITSASPLDALSQDKTAPVSLNEYKASKKQSGWVLSGTDPYTPQAQKVTVVVGGNLNGLEKKQQVTLKYSWIVVSEIYTKPDTEDAVKIEFAACDTDESVFDIESDEGGSTRYELDVSKKINKGNGGTSIKKMSRPKKPRRKRSWVFNRQWRFTLSKNRHA